jgi:hypothetical protein
MNANPSSNKRCPASARAVVATPVLLATTGCAYSPSFNILGSYFPSWIVCCAVAAAVTFAAHRLFTKWKIVTELWPLPLVYTALFSFVSCIVWIIFFS